MTIPTRAASPVRSLSLGKLWKTTHQSHSGVFHLRD